jgi:hypothetical protein
LSKNFLCTSVTPAYGVCDGVLAQFEEREENCIRDIPIAFRAANGKKLQFSIR